VTADKGSPNESDDAVPSHTTVVVSGGIGVEAHQILAHKTPSTTRHIPPPGAGKAGSARTRHVANSAAVIYP
jgi:hypothetical protein